jgi:hypothetical protein
MPTGPFKRRPTNVLERGDSPMSRSSLIRMSALLPVLAAAVLFASTAQAGEMIAENGVPTLGTSDAQFKDGTVDWNYSGSTLYADLYGTLVLNDASGTCARMRLDYLYQGPIVDTLYGGEVCAPDGSKNEWNVNFVDHIPSGNVDNVKVSIETKTGSHDWAIKDSAYSSPQPPSDKVRLHYSAEDFGDDYWSEITMETGGSGTMYWNRATEEAYTPRLMGTLWVQWGRCARMHLTYKDENGHVLADKNGGPACAYDFDDDVQPFTVDLSPYTGTNIRSVTVQIQEQGLHNGPYFDIDPSHAQTVYIDSLK